MVKQGVNVFPHKTDFNDLYIFYLIYDLSVTSPISRFNNHV